MPTPSETTQPFEPTGQANRWAAQSGAAPSSVFANFRTTGERTPVSKEDADPKPCKPKLEPNSDHALARAFFYGYLATAFQDPTEEGWLWLGDDQILSTMASSARLLNSAELEETIRALAAEFPTQTFTEFAGAYVEAFGHAARGRCPMNEIEYGDANADPLFQPHRLADLAAFYRAFGLEPTDDAGERQDHLCMELEFMSVLAAKVAYAAEHGVGPSESAACADAQKRFLREHLGRWGVAFARRLTGEIDRGPLAAFGSLLRLFIEEECRRFEVSPGSDVLALRPVDEAAETLCGSCGLCNLPPGALAEGAGLDHA